jgi:hypothetical protein
VTPSDDQKWERFAETLLELHGSTGTITVDLRRPLGVSMRERLAELGPLGEFAVVTAANPKGEQVSPAENEVRHERLRAAIVRDGAYFIRADGVSPDGSHRERGFAVWTSRQGGKRLAVEFEQLAFFLYDGDAFWIIGGLDAAEPVRLPREIT